MSTYTHGAFLWVIFTVQWWQRNNTLQLFMFCFHFLVFMKNLNKQKFQHFNKELVSHVSRFCSVKLKIKIYTCCSFIWVFFFFVGVFFCTLHSTLVSSSRFPVYASLLFWHSCVPCPVCFILLPLCHHVYLYLVSTSPIIPLCISIFSLPLFICFYLCHVTGILKSHHVHVSQV